MDVSDASLMVNRDWDPSYLRSILDADFYDFSNLWTNSVKDSELIEVADDVERYSPIVEDVSLEDNVLCEAVEQIEKRYVWYKICLSLIK